MNRTCGSRTVRRVGMLAAAAGVPGRRPPGRCPGWPEQLARDASGRVAAGRPALAAGGAEWHSAWWMADWWCQDTTDRPSTMRNGSPNRPASQRMGSPDAPPACGRGRPGRPARQRQRASRTGRPAGGRCRAGCHAAGGQPHPARHVNLALLPLDGADQRACYPLRGQRSGPPPAVRAAPVLEERGVDDAGHDRPIRPRRGRPGRRPGSRRSSRDPPWPRSTRPPRVRRSRRRWRRRTPGDHARARPCPA